MQGGSNSCEKWTEEDEMLRSVLGVMLEALSSNRHSQFISYSFKAVGTPYR